MSNRNVIEIKINVESEHVIPYEQGLIVLEDHPEIKQLGFKNLLSVNEVISLLDLSRAAIERNILDNELIGKGVRHLNVTGENFPKTRIFINPEDLIIYLIEHCNLEYFKLISRGDKQKLEPFSKKTLLKEDVQYLTRTLIEGRLKSSNEMQQLFGRSRAMISRLSNIVESITFSFPGSQRSLRRFIIRPEMSYEEFEKYFHHYKVHEKQMIKD